MVEMRDSVFVEEFADHPFCHFPVQPTTDSSVHTFIIGARARNDKPFDVVIIVGDLFDA